MSSLRLKQNLIINGKFHPSGSLLDKALIPPKFLTETYVADPQNREGRVLLLRNLSFMSRPKPDSSGWLPLIQSMSGPVNSLISPKSRRVIGNP
jgi:hypothetical protein